MKARASGPCCWRMVVNFFFDDVEGFVPGGLNEGVTFSEERFDEAIG